MTGASRADGSATLTLAEGVELCAAWSQGLARWSGIRVLLIKGASLSRQGLREERVSMDVDLLVEPAGFDALCAQLEEAGWTERPLPFISNHVSGHSRTYLRENWPCDIDVHRHFPGFLAEPGTVFEELWARKESLPFAHIAVDIPDRASSILILALHSLRDGNVETRHRSELDRLRDVAITDEDRARLAELCAGTASAIPLAELLPTWGIALDAEQTRRSQALADPARLRDWRGRVASKSQGAYVWWVTLGRTTWRAKPRLILSAIWPTSVDLRLSHPEVPPALWPLLWARTARMWRGIRGIPASVRALRVRQGGS